MNISTKGGAAVTVVSGQTVRDALSAVGVAVGPDILAAKVNDQIVDLSKPLTGDAVIEPLRFDSPEGREVYRHSSKIGRAHV